MGAQWEETWAVYKNTVLNRVYNSQTTDLGTLQQLVGQGWPHGLQFPRAVWEGSTLVLNLLFLLSLFSFVLWGKHCIVEAAQPQSLCPAVLVQCRQGRMEAATGWGRDRGGRGTAVG